MPFEPIRMIRALFLAALVAASGLCVAVAA